MEASAAELAALDRVEINSGKLATASRSASYASLLSRADGALLTAKSAGRNMTVRAKATPART
jgi:PleD family two-component response regulator